MIQVDLEVKKIFILYEKVLKTIYLIQGNSKKVVNWKN